MSEPPDDPPEVPPSAQRAAENGLARRAEHGGFMTPGLQAAAQQQQRLTVGSPHRMSVLPLRRVLAGASLRASAQFVGWRFLVRADGKAIAAAQTVPDREGGWRLTELSEGSLTSATEAALASLFDELATLPAMAAVANPNYQLLLVPAASAAVIWVRRSGQTEDVVMALKIPGTSLPRGFIPASEFICLIRETEENARQGGQAAAPCPSEPRQKPTESKQKPSQPKQKRTRRDPRA
jgi:hypothetical protein